MTVAPSRLRFILLSFRGIDRELMLNILVGQFKAVLSKEGNCFANLTK